MNKKKTKQFRQFIFDINNKQEKTNKNTLPAHKIYLKYPWHIKLDSGQLLVHKPKTSAEHVVFTGKIKH